MNFFFYLALKFLDSLVELDNEMYITAGTIFIGLRKHMQDDISRYILQVEGCSLKFNHNWKTAGTKNN